MQTLTAIIFCIFSISATAQIKKTTSAKPKVVINQSEKVILTPIIPCTCKLDSINKKKYGFCDTLTIAEAIKCKYDSAIKFNDGLARVFVNGKVGYIDKKGKEVIPIIYEEGEDFSEGFAYVKKGGNHFYINKLGINVFKKNFPFPNAKFPDNLSDATKQSILDVMAKHKKLFCFNEGLAIFIDTTTKKYGYINLKGITVVPANYAIAYGFNEGVAFVKETNTTTFKAIDKKGIKIFELPEKTTPLQEGFINNFVTVTIKENTNEYKLWYNLIDKTGKLLLAKNAEQIKPFKNGYAVIKHENSYPIIINPRGEKILSEEFRYLEVTDIQDVFFYSNNINRGFGLLNNKGQRITSAGYTNFNLINDTVFLAKPWGTSIYTLLSTNFGKLINSYFTNFEWTKATPNPILTLWRKTSFNDGYSELSYDPIAGKFIKDGKELLSKENYYLAKKEEIKKGEIKFSNNYFSLEFPEEMELYESNTTSTIYRNSTYFFSIIQANFTGTANEYLSALKNKFITSKEYESVELKGITVSGKYMQYLEAIKKVTDTKSTKGKSFYMPIDNSLISLSGNKMYVLLSSYFVVDERIQNPKLLETYRSIKFK